MDKHRMYMHCIAALLAQPAGSVHAQTGDAVLDIVQHPVQVAAYSCASFRHHQQSA